ncbi:MAG: serine protease Do [Halobacteriales archaeon]|jgi:serine protease Do
MPNEDVSRRRFLGLSAGVVATGIAGCSAPTGTTADLEATTTTVGDGPETGANDGDSGSVYTRVYEETIGSVVLIETAAGQGTGFVFDDRHLVTNAHVVGASETVQVRFGDGEWRTGRVVGSDLYSDLAAVRVEDRPAYARPLSLLASDPSVGQEVVVIGNPFGLSGTVTTGIVSGINRSIPGPTGYRIPDAIQTDAAVNPGNSGGPIVSLDGDVIAVVNSGGGENVAFGISGPLVRRVVPALIENGEYDHPYMGVTLRTVTPAIATANDLDRPRGVLVVDILENGPSDGVLRRSTESAFVDGERVPVGGDVVLAMDDTGLTRVEDLSSFLALRASPGAEIELRVLRDGELRTVELELGRRPPPR